MVSPKISQGLLFCYIFGMILHFQILCHKTLLFILGSMSLEKRATQRRLQTHQKVINIVIKIRKFKEKNSSETSFLYIFCSLPIFTKI